MLNTILKQEPKVDDQKFNLKKIYIYFFVHQQMVLHLINKGKEKKNVPNLSF